MLFIRHISKNYKDKKAVESGVLKSPNINVLSPLQIFVPMLEACIFKIVIDELIPLSLHDDFVSVVFDLKFTLSDTSIAIPAPFWVSICVESSCIPVL